MGLGFSLVEETTPRAHPGPKEATTPAVQELTFPAVYFRGLGGMKVNPHPALSRWTKTDMQRKVIEIQDKIDTAADLDVKIRLTLLRDAWTKQAEEFTGT